MKVGSKYVSTHLKLVKKPTRPRSAYNYFFQAEREKILSGETADGISVEGGQEKCSTGGEQRVERDISKSEAVCDVVIGRTKIPEKISFSDLGKTIGRRWHRINANAEDIAEYVIAAASDKARYQREMIGYKNERKAAYKIPVEGSQEQYMVKLKEKVTEDIRAKQALEQELIRLKNVPSENNDKSSFQQKTADFQQQELQGRRDTTTGQLLSPFSTYRETATGMPFDSLQNHPVNRIPNWYRESMFQGNSSNKTVEMRTFKSFSQATASGVNNSFFDGPNPYTSHEQTRNYHHQLYRHTEENLQLRDGSSLEPDSQVFVNRNVQENTGYPNGRSYLTGQTAEESKMIQYPWQSPNRQTHHTCNGVHSSRTIFDMQSKLNLFAQQSNISSGNSSRFADGRMPYTSPEPNNYHQPTVEMQNKCSLVAQLSNTANANSGRFNDGHISFASSEKNYHRHLLSQANILSRSNSSSCYHDGRIPCTSQEQPSYCELGGGGPFFESNTNFCKINGTQEYKGNPHDRSALIGQTANESGMFNSRHSSAWHVPPSVSGQGLMQIPCPSRGGYDGQIYRNETAFHSGNNFKDNFKEGDQSKSDCAFVDTKVIQFLHHHNHLLYNGPLNVNGKPSNENVHRGVNDFSTPESRHQAKHFQNNCHINGNNYNCQGTQVTPYDLSFGPAALSRSFPNNEFEIKPAKTTGPVNGVIPQESNQCQAKFGIQQPQSSNGIYQYSSNSFHYANPDFNSFANI